MKLKGLIRRDMIAQTIDSVDKFSEKNGLSRDSRVQMSMILEEIMLVYLEHLGEGAAFSLTVVRKNGDIRTCFEVKGCSFDPTDPGTPVLNHISESLNSAPEWEYINGFNRVSFVFQAFLTLRKNLRFSWKYMSGQRKFFIIALSSQVITVVLSIISPLLSARLIVAYTETVYKQIILTGLALLAVRFINNIFLFLTNHSYNVVYNKTLSAMEEDMVDSVLKISKSCMDEQGSGLFIQRLTVDTTRIATGFNTIADMSTSLFRYFGILGAMLYIDPKVFFVVIALMLMQAWFEKIRTTKLNIDDRIYRESNERFTGLIGEMVRGVTDVKMLNSEATFKEDLALRINDANGKRMIMQDRSWAYKLSRMEIGALIFFGFIALLAYMISDGSLQPVIAIVLFDYYSQIDYDAIAAIGEFLEFIKDFNLSSERINSLLYGRQFPKEHFGKEHIEPVSGDVCFDNVTFSYKNPDPHTTSKTVLNNMSFFIPAGTTAAFVGKSGAGKSTTINLIGKLYEATGGTVKIDGVDIRLLDKDTIRSNISVVSQQPYIFNLSIRENFRLIKPDITEEEMIDACRKTCIYDDISEMPNGFDTIIGEDGINLSGGQRQRIAIARTLIRKYRILLLDEATSSLDNINQAYIQKTLDNIHGQATVIIVAHRLSTVKNADRIFFIESGRILDSGTHKELLSRCEQYRELYES